MKIKSHLSFIFLLFLNFIPTTFAEPNFEIFQFLPYSGYSINGKVVAGRPTKEYFESLGLKKINLIYEVHILDYPTDKLNGVPNREKINELAKLASAELNVPIALDLEGWYRYDKIKTPQRMNEVINLFRENNLKFNIGLYATVPQNNYGKTDPKSMDGYHEFNKSYVSVAENVNYFSPSLYNYTTDDESWKKSAEFNIKEARLYSKSKKIYPYITAEKQAGKWLNYAEMMFRLKTLKALGADGCIIWGSSSALTADGKHAVFDTTQKDGWAKAIVDFANVK